MAARFSVRFRGAVGIADSDWLDLAPGVSVITGRNNVGKSRILKGIGDLRNVASDPDLFPGAPQVRLFADDSIIEADIRARLVGREMICPISYSAYASADGPKTFEVSWGETVSGQQIVFGPPQGPKQTAGLNKKGSRSGQMIPMLPSMYFLVGLPELLSTLSRLVYIPPERPIRAQHEANPVPVPRPDGSDLPQALYNHIGNKTEQMAAVEKVFFEMFPEVGAIITSPYGRGQIELRFRDRFAESDISLDDVGTGLARMLHLIACILLYEPGRVFLIDEPTTHLHPGAEKVLASFIRSHLEHDYVISTHSPIFINTIQPDRSWLTVRDQRGTVIQPSFSEQATRHHVFQELGVSPGDVAIAERVLFVEGLTDRLVYPIILRKLGWDLVAANCEVIDIMGAEVAHPLQQVVDQLAGLINVRYLIYLDGDKRGSLRGEQVKYLPVPEIEDLFLGSPTAIYAGFHTVLAQERPNLLAQWQATWDPEGVARFIKENRNQVKGKRVLKSLAQAMKLDYRPAVYGPAIGEAMSARDFENLRGDFRALFE